MTNTPQQSGSDYGASLSPNTFFTPPPYMTEQRADIQQPPANIPNMTANEGEDAPEQGRQDKGKGRAEEPVANVMKVRSLGKRTVTTGVQPES